MVYYIWCSQIKCTYKSVLNISWHNLTPKCCSSEFLPKSESNGYIYMHCILHPKILILQNYIITLHSLRSTCNKHNQNLLGNRSILYKTQNWYHLQGTTFGIFFSETKQWQFPTSIQTLTSKTVLQGHLQYPVFIPCSHLACKWLVISVLSVQNLSSLKWKGCAILLWIITRMNSGQSTTTKTDAARNFVDEDELPTTSQTDER